ncbi:hypothetical protein [Prochlorothrix hollandica]|uniref:hypothetical protein n=1 Tax=Prochlorothrix hollandica TaxID=1223 RepID=UPI0033411A6B
MALRSAWAIVNRQTPRDGKRTTLMQGWVPWSSSETGTLSSLGSSVWCSFLLDRDFLDRDFLDGNSLDRD